MILHRTANCSRAGADRLGITADRAIEPEGDGRSGDRKEFPHRFIIGAAVRPAYGILVSGPEAAVGGLKIATSGLQLSGAGNPAWSRFSGGFFGPYASLRAQRAPAESRLQPGLAAPQHAPRQASANEWTEHTSERTTSGPNFPSTSMTASPSPKRRSTITFRSPHLSPISAHSRRNYPVRKFLLGGFAPFELNHRKGESQQREDSNRRR